MATKINYSIARLADVIDQLDPSVPVAFDTETKGLYGRVCLAQFYQPQWDCPLLVHMPNQFELAALLSLPTYHWLMYNGAYDLSTIQEQVSTVYPAKYDDLLFMVRLAYPEKNEFSLDNALHYLIGYDVYEDAGLDKSLMHKLDWSKPLTEDMKQYAALDVLYLHALYHTHEAILDDFNYKLDMLTTKYFITQLQPTGLPVDQDRLEVKRAANLARVAEIALPINCNSYQQVRPYIGSVESDDLGLAKLAMQGNEKAKAVRETRKLLKENSFLAKFTGDRIYGKFSPSTRSGRSACKDQNLQQLPRSTKGLFGFSSDSDRTLIFSDYAQLELRCAAVAVPEHLMVQLMTNGEDMHNYVAETIFGKDFTKQQRQIAKTCNFNLLYGGSAAMLQSILIAKADVWLELEEVDTIRRKWLNLFSGFAGWHEKAIRAWRAKRVWATPSGRQYLGKLMTDQVNIMIQGMGAEVSKLAMHYMFKDGWFLANDIKLANFVHDSYIFDAPDNPELYQEAARRVASAMQQAWVDISAQCTIKDLAMPVQVLVGKNWGDIEKGVYDYEYKI